MKESYGFAKPVLFGTVVAALLAVPFASGVQATTVDPTLLLIRQVYNAVISTQRGVVALQAGLAALTDPAQANLRYTPPMFVPDSSGMLCEVSNVDDVAHAVKVELIDGFTGLVSATFVDGTIPLPPGQVWVASAGRPRGAYYCKFTVLDGSRTDIRASATVLAGGPTLAAE